MNRLNNIGNAYIHSFGTDTICCLVGLIVFCVATMLGNLWILLVSLLFSTLMLYLYTASLTNALLNRKNDLFIVRKTFGYSIIQQHTSLLAIISKKARDKARRELKADRLHKAISSLPVGTYYCNTHDSIIRQLERHLPDNAYIEYKRFYGTSRLFLERLIFKKPKDELFNMYVVKIVVT